MRKTGIIAFLLSLIVALPVYADINSDLIGAARKGDVATVKLLLDKGADVNARYKNKITSLMYAAREGHTEIVKLLLAKGAEVNSKDRFGGTALMMAKRTGSTEIVKLLLDRGADVNIKDNSSETALNNMNSKGNTDLPKALLLGVSLLLIIKLIKMNMREKTKTTRKSSLQGVLVETAMTAAGFAAILVLVGILFWHRSPPAMILTIWNMKWILLGAGFCIVLLKRVGL